MRDKSRGMVPFGTLGPWITIFNTGPIRTTIIYLYEPWMKWLFNVLQESLLDKNWPADYSITFASSHTLSLQEDIQASQPWLNVQILRLILWGVNSRKDLADIYVLIGSNKLTTVVTSSSVSSSQPMRFPIWKKSLLYFSLFVGNFQLQSDVNSFIINS